MSNHANLPQVNVNRKILRSEHTRNCQLILASFHFGCTSLTSKVISRRHSGAAEGKMTVPWKTRSILAILACLSVTLDNFALANLPPFTHQMIRILVTPMTAIVGRLTTEFIVDRSSALRLAVACGGVAISLQSERSSDAIFVPTPSAVMVGLIAVLIRSVYAVEVSRVQRRRQISSTRLLELQMPLACLFLLSFSPFTDVLPGTELASVNIMVAVIIVSVRYMRVLNRY